MRLLLRTSLPLACLCLSLAIASSAGASTASSSSVKLRGQPKAQTKKCYGLPISMVEPRLVRALGGWRVDTDLKAKYAGAVRVFGKPARRWKTGHNHTKFHAVWRGRHAMHLVFESNYPPDVTDDYSAGFLLTGTLTGTAWQTAQGMHIGQPLTQLQARHPHAWQVTPRTWSLADYCPEELPDSTGDTKVSLLAVFHKHRLSGLRVRTRISDEFM